MSQHAIDFIEKLVRKNPDERMKAHEALKHPFLLKVEAS
jgi:serine/threonine protein kinase